jgi:hypothetical protein
MATPKTVTVSNIEQGRLYIDPIDEEGRLPVQRDYTLVGDDQTLLDRSGTFVMSRNPLWSDVPANIQAALLEINAWTATEILSDEGMS